LYNGLVHCIIPLYLTEEFSSWLILNQVDLAYLNKQARESLRFHVEERLPSQYQKCLNGLNQVLKLAWNIVLLDTNNHNTRLQALSLINDCYKYQMDLTANGVVITDAIKYVNGKMEHLNKEEKELLQDIQDQKKEEDEAEDVRIRYRTTNS
jgi:hypothetical protein